MGKPHGKELERALRTALDSPEVAEALDRNLAAEEAALFLVCWSREVQKGKRKGKVIGSRAYRLVCAAIDPGCAGFLTEAALVRWAGSDAELGDLIATILKRAFDAKGRFIVTAVPERAIRGWNTRQPLGKKDVYFPDYDRIVTHAP